MMAPITRSVLLLLGLASLCAVEAQICNNKAQKSGGLFFPAFGSGGSKASYTNGTQVERCFMNMSDPGERNDYGCTAAPTDPQVGMAVVYFLLLCYVFMGVSIIADIFMSAIEAITSKSTLVEKVDEEDNVTQYEIKTWNATVANLTLMALGSSAPEILLSVIEIFSNDFYAGDLGPGTIVGSAAFNLLVIIGICVYCIPEKGSSPGETGVRRIEDLGVYAITAVSSVFAYLWLLVILMVWTPEIVTVEEAVITFMMFPVLVLFAWLADTGYFSRSSQRVEPREFVTGVDNPQANGGRRASGAEAAKMLKKITKGENKSLTSAVGDMVHGKNRQKKSRAFWRVQAQRKMTGGEAITDPNKISMEDMELLHVAIDPNSVRTFLGFKNQRLQCMETDGEVTMEVIRTGDIDCKTVVEYGTSGLTATGGADYEDTKGTLVFNRGEMSKQFQVKIFEDTVSDNNESFFSFIFNASQGVAIAEGQEKCKVKIIDSKSPGELEFAKTNMGSKTAEYTCKESAGVVNVVVQRVGGHSGTCSVRYQTKSGTAMAKSDFEPLDDVIVFEHGEVSKMIPVTIINSQEYERTETFTLVLSDPNKCKMGAIRIAVITIEADEAMKAASDRLAKMMANLNMDKIRLGAADYKGQFTNALVLADGNPCSKFISILTIPFKLIFAFVPPTIYFGGYLCFFSALGMITLVTICISDLASLAGCALGVEDSITAITIVALGTSLPDTFASQSAAVGDDSADSSVGNVTGSNSVNVFLGLGAPWMAAAIYWAIQAPLNGSPMDKWRAKYPKEALMYPGGGFVVQSGNLGFSVIVFSICAVVCLLLLTLRRKLFGAELGGPAKTPFAAAMIGLWLIYITASILYTKGVLVL